MSPIARESPRESENWAGESQDTFELHAYLLHGFEMQADAGLRPAEPKRSIFQSDDGNNFLNQPVYSMDTIERMTKTTVKTMVPRKSQRSMPRLVR